MIMNLNYEEEEKISKGVSEIYIIQALTYQDSTEWDHKLPESNQSFHTLRNWVPEKWNCLFLIKIFLKKRKVGWIILRR